METFFNIYITVFLQKIITGEVPSLYLCSEQENVSNDIMKNSQKPLVKKSKYAREKTLRAQFFGHFLQNAEL